MDCFNKPPTVDFKSRNLAEVWEQWKKTFEVFMQATGKDSSQEKQKIAIFLNLIGNEGLEMYNTFQFTEAETPQTLEIVTKKFDDICKPRKNTVFDRYKFFSRAQQEGEPIDFYLTELKKLASTCEFGDQLDALLRDRIVIGIRDKSVQERLLRDSEITLVRAVNVCRASEISKEQMTEMADTSSAADTIKFKTKDHKWKKRNDQKMQQNQKKTCSRCGTTHEPKKCPAYGKTCMKCKRQNHFAKVCRAKWVNAVENEEEEESGSDFQIESIQCNTVNTIEWRETVVVNGTKISMKLDTGAECNIISQSLVKSLKIKPEIEVTNKVVTSYTGHRIKIIGTATINCKTTKKSTYLKFFIVAADTQPILGLQACQMLELVKRVNTIATSNIYEKYKNVFDGKIGNLPYTYDIKLEPNVEGKIFPARIIPRALKNAVKKEIDRMVEGEILRKVTEPTEWTHPIVIVEKANGSVRICMDPRELNKHIKREHYHIPTQETIYSELKGANYFTVLDASSAFLQIKLTENSAKLCTIATPFGRYQFLRLPYGLSSSPEVFQRTISDIVAGMEGIKVYIDDILVYGKTQEEHNERLEKLLIRAEKVGLKFNKKKTQLCVNKVKYLGHEISNKGITPDENKIKAITEYKIPKNKTELHRFIGMVNYVAKFIPNISDKTANLRRLLSTKNEFIWEGKEQECFENLKKLITHAPVLQYYNPNVKATLSVDASQYGLGAVLMQDGKPIAYSSVTLTDTQQRYSQIEKELLAILYGCKRFDYYLYGTVFDIESDHKPLIGLLKKPIDSLSPRLQRMVIKLLRYQINIIHVPGKNMFTADALSRSPTEEIMDTKYIEENIKVHSILSMTDKRKSELSAATSEDQELQILKHYVKNGWPQHKRLIKPEHCCINKYWQHRAIIHENKNLLFMGNRLIIPKKWQNKIIDYLHMAHQGIVSCKLKAYNSVYWPGMTKQIEEKIGNCVICQSYSKSYAREPVMMYPIPKLPWEEVGIDFLKESQNDYLVLVDYHSKFIEVRKMKGKDANATISALTSIFRTHGIPKVIHSDNGPPFDSKAYKMFMENIDSEICTSSPKYPKSNGMIERAIQTIKGLIIKARKDKKDPNLAILEYNNTPKQDLPAPAVMLMGRVLRTLVPAVLQQKVETKQNLQKLRKRQEKQIPYANQHSKKLENLKSGQDVMIQVETRKWTPGRIIKPHEKPNSYYVETPSGSKFRRNRIHLKSHQRNVLTDGKEDQMESARRQEDEEDNKQQDIEPRFESSLKEQQTLEESTNQKEPKVIQPPNEMQSQEWHRRPQRQRKMPEKLKDYIVN